MAFLDWLKQYLPEDTTGTEEQDYTSDISGDNYIEPTQISRAPTIQPAPSLNYGDMFLRTPAKEEDAKAANELRTLLFPEPKAPLMTPMSNAQMTSQTSSTESTVPSPTPEVEKRHVKVAPKESTEDALKEMEAEVGEPSKLDALLTQLKGPDDELEAAQKARREQLGIANILEGLAKAGTAVATRGRHTYQELTPDAFKGMKEMAQLRVEDVKEKRKAKAEEIAQRQSIIGTAKGELDFHREEERNDPNSDASKMYREVIQQAMPELKIPKSISAANLDKLVGPLQNAANMKMAMESKKEIAELNRLMREETKQEKREKVAFEQQERYQKDLSKLDDKNREATKYMDEAYALAGEATKNPQAALNLARSVIKAIEGAGARVSDKDFTTAVGDKALGARLANQVNEMATGTIRNVTAKDVRLMLDASRKIQQQKHQEGTKALVERFAKRANVTPQEAADIGVVPQKVLEKQVIKKEYSASRNQTRLTYSDGSQEVLDGQQ